MTRSLRHRSPASAGQIRVGVERLALYGFNRAEAHRVAAAMEAELGRLASRPGLCRGEPRGRRPGALPAVTRSGSDGPRRRAGAVGGNFRV
jgi:glycine/serine hydroxymethyltransferase